VQQLGLVPALEQELVPALEPVADFQPVFAEQPEEAASAFVAGVDFLFCCQKISF
jgi:hypothetical protein